ncbi:MAG: DUF1850 domain-containing protein [Synergistaceae bacterium]|nr:DUF1850 domain-containing protein [Synergistaceae bacterium]
MIPRIKKWITALFLLCIVVYFAVIPFPALILRDSSGTLLYKFYISPGDPFTLRFIHSVENTPVEDEYRGVGGRIRLWEERTVSHNAGLPTEAPRNGRFIMGPDWMHVRGGGQSLALLRYRVGNAHLGRNTLTFSKKNEISLFEKHPLSVIEFSIRH